MEEAYINFAQAIVISAAKDYIKALNKLMKNPKNEMALYTKDECEKFFRSDWYSTLTDSDGERLLKALQKEVLEGRKTWTQKSI